MGLLRAGCPALLAAALCTAPATAQAPHPIPTPVRALHARAALADVIALVAVERIEEGRIAVTTRVALRGAPAAAFEVKRSPLHPPPLAAGDRALLFLRGARPPYVLVDAAHEVARVASDAELAALHDAIAALLDATSDPPRLAALYAGWLAPGAAISPDLAEFGLRNLIEEHSEVARTLVRAAVDRERSIDARMRLASLAVLSPEGAQDLLRALGVKSVAEDAPILRTVLQAAVLWRLPEAVPLARKLRASGDAESRTLAERVLRALDRPAQPASRTSG